MDNTNILSVCRIMVLSVYCSSFYLLAYFVFPCPPPPAALWLPRLVPVVVIWASRIVRCLALTLHKALPLVTYSSSIPTNNHPATTNTNRYNKVSVCVCMCVLHIHVHACRDTNVLLNIDKCFHVSVCAHIHLNDLLQDISVVSVLCMWFTCQQCTIRQLEIYKI